MQAYTLSARPAAGTVIPSSVPVEEPSCHNQIGGMQSCLSPLPFHKGKAHSKKSHHDDYWCTLKLWCHLVSPFSEYCSMVEIKVFQMSILFGSNEPNEAASEC